jgi:predicted GIY-YIG superfamily endonuclease
MNFNSTWIKRGASWGFWTGAFLGIIVSANNGFSGSTEIADLILLPVILAFCLALCGSTFGVAVNIGFLVLVGVLNLLRWIVSLLVEILFNTEVDPGTDNQTVQEQLSPSPHHGAIPRGRMRTTDRIEDLPEKPGLYRHINKESGCVEYIGQTNNIKRRNQEHKAREKLDLSTQKIAYAVAHPDADRQKLCDAEKRHIKKHNPSGNKYKGGNGRR